MINRTCPPLPPANNKAWVVGAYHSRTCTAPLLKNRRNRCTVLNFRARNCTLGRGREGLTLALSGSVSQLHPTRPALLFQPLPFRSSVQ